MEEKDLNYIRCSNCGKYFASEEENKICSDECKTYYESCRACGNYFISSRKENTIYCSNECGITPKLEVPAQHQPLSLLQPPRTLSVDNL